MLNIDGAKSFYEYPKNYEGADKFINIQKPVTEYQKNLAELSVHPVERFIKYLVCKHDNDFESPAGVLYRDFMEWKTVNGVKYEMSSIKFGVKLSNLSLPGVSIHRANKGKTRVFDYDVLCKHFGIGCLVVLD